MNYNEEGHLNMSETTIPQDKLARVKYSIGMTINLGNYQSAKVEIGVEFPGHITEIDNIYDEAGEFCDTRLIEEINRLQVLKKEDK